MQTLPKCGRLARTISGLKLEAHGVAAVIRHEEREDIKIHAREPANWYVDDEGTICQRNAGDALRSAIERSSVKNAEGSVVDSIYIKGDLAVVDGEVFVNGHKVLAEQVAEPGNQVRQEPDKLYLLVPEAFRGGLAITISAGASVDIDTWNGGDISLTASAGSTVCIGPLADLNSFVLNGQGLGKVEIESIRTQSLRVSKQGVGDLNIGPVVTDSFELIQTGMGKTKIAGVLAQTGVLTQRGSGKVDIGELSAETFHLTQSGGSNMRIGDTETQSFAAEKEGGCNLSITKLVTDSLQVSQVGLGDTSIDSGSAQSGSARTEGAGSIILRGRFDNISKRSSGIGRVEIQEPA